MSIIEAILLGCLQGVAEFLPISSSGHLALAQLLLGYDKADHYLIFNIVLHLGTILAIFIGLWQPIRSLSKRDIAQIFLALLPLFPIVFLIKPIKAMMQLDSTLGICFLIGGSWILLGEKLGKRFPSDAKRSPQFSHALCIGIAQAMSVLPGISRLGATTATALSLGWSRPQALVFSFLLAIPTVIGATIVELKDLFTESTLPSNVAPIHYLIGFFSALCVGLVTLNIIRRIAEAATFKGFGYYCLTVGILTLAAYQLGVF